MIQEFNFDVKDDITISNRGFEKTVEFSADKRDVIDSLDMKDVYDWKGYEELLKQCTLNEILRYLEDYHDISIETK